MHDRQQGSSQNPSAGRSHRGPLAVALATSVIAVSGASLVYPALPILGNDLAVETAGIGLIITAFTAPAIVLAPIFGVVADLKGRRPLLIFGLALFGLAGAAAALAPSFGWLLACRALQGVGMSALSPLTIALISDILPPEREIDGQGLKVSIDRIAFILFPIVGGYLAMASWRYVFVCFLLVLPVALIAWRRMPETNPVGGEAEGLKPYLLRTLRALREPRLTIAFGTGFLRFFLDYGLFTYLPLLIALHHAGAPATAGWLLALSAFGAILTAMNIGRIHRRYAAEPLLALAFLASAVALALVALDQPIWVIGFAAFLFGLGNGLISPLQKSLLTRRTPVNLRGGVISVDRMIQQIAKSLAPALLGLLLLWASIESLFWVLAGFSAIGLIVLGGVAYANRAVGQPRMRIP